MDGTLGGKNDHDNYNNDNYNIINNTNNDGKCSVICPSHNWIHWLFISGQNMVLFNLEIVCLFFVGNC